jgi:phospholipase/carboxylesterase
MRAALGLLLFAASASHAAPYDARGALAARPGAVTSTLAGGESRLPDGALVYRPATAPAGPRPLLVILHGFGQDPTGFERSFKRWADRCGAVMIGPVARDVTWDMIATSRALDTRRTRPSQPPMRFGQDARRIDRDLAALFAAAPIDPARVALLGFSDGASYALSLGLANPELFRWVIALSPGFALWPDRVALKQKIFIAHGTRDSRLDFSATRDGIVKPLRDAGLDVRFRQFDGDHVLVRPIVQESLKLAFGC